MNSGCLKVWSLQMKESSLVAWLTRIVALSVSAGFRLLWAVVGRSRNRGTLAFPSLQNCCRLLADEYRARYWSDVSVARLIERPADLVGRSQSVFLLGTTDYLSTIIWPLPCQRFRPHQRGVIGTQVPLSLQIAIQPTWSYFGIWEVFRSRQDLAEAPTFWMVRKVTAHPFVERRISFEFL